MAVGEQPALKVSSKVFITGANGFIGRALAGRLRELGVEVGGVDLVGDSENGIVAGSTVDPTSWSDALAGAEVLIHAAALVSNSSPLDQAWEVNVLGTRRVLDAAIAAGTRRFVHLSSVAAYGFNFPDGVDETYPARVNGYSYTDTKVNSEAVVMTAHAAGEIQCTVIRPGDVYGPESRPWVVLPLEMIKSGQMLLPNRGRGIFSPCYLDTLVDGMILAISSEAAAGHVFILSDGYGVTCGEYFGRLADMVGKNIRTLPTGVAVALADAVGSLQRRFGQASELNAATMHMLNRPGTYSIEKARATLGFDPKVSLDEGMRRVEEWARETGLI